MFGLVCEFYQPLYACMHLHIYVPCIHKCCMFEGLHKYVCIHLQFNPMQWNLDLNILLLNEIQ